MEKLKILHMYPNMLDLYGDSGNQTVYAVPYDMPVIGFGTMISSILAAVLTLNSRYLPMTSFPARTVSWKLIRQEHFF